MEKTIKKSKTHILMALTTTLLLNNFYIFGMLTDSDEERSVIIRIKKPQRDRLRKTIYKKNYNTAPEIITVSQMDQMDPIPNIKMYQGGAKLTDLPLDCLEKIAEYVSYEWEDLINVMAQRSDLYLAGLEFLARSNSEMLIEIAGKDLIDIIDFKRSIKKRKIQLFDHRALKSLIFAKKYLEQILDKRFFHNRKINRKIKKLWYSKRTKKRFDQLLELVRANIEQHIIYKLIDKETSRYIEFQYNATSEELEKAIEKIEKTPNIRDHILEQRFLIGLLTAIIITFIVGIILTVSIILPVYFAVEHANRCGCSYEYCSDNCPSCTEHEICWDVCIKSHIESQCIDPEQCIPQFICDEYGTECRTEKALYKCSYRDSLLGNAPTNQIKKSLCGFMFDLCEDAETREQTEQLDSAHKLCSGQATFSQACAEIMDMNETQANLEPTAEVFQKMRTKCANQCISGGAPTQCVNELNHFCDN